MLPSYIFTANSVTLQPLGTQHLQKLLCNQCNICGLLMCLQLIRSHLSPRPPAPSDPGGLGTATAEVKEPQDGATRSPPSKADLLKMKDLILTDSSVEAS
jgi:hypothetical protein